MRMELFFKRLVAWVIDAVIITAVSAMLGPLGGVVWLVYHVVLLVQWKGQTIGKKALGLKVTALSGKLDWTKALVRTLMTIVSAFFLGLGYLWMLWDKKGQTWHDKVAETKVS